MKTINVSDLEWKLLGELELAFSAQMEGVTSTWLEKVLEPLGLSIDLRTRILNSAQEAVARILQSNSTVLEVSHIHLRILITPDHTPDEKTWGFFRIEKTDGAGNDHNPHGHSIEFYLYMENR